MPLFKNSNPADDCLSQARLWSLQTLRDALPSEPLKQNLDFIDRYRNLIPLLTCYADSSLSPIKAKKLVYEIINRMIINFPQKLLQKQTIMPWINTNLSKLVEEARSIADLSALQLDMASAISSCLKSATRHFTEIRSEFHRSCELLLDLLLLLLLKEDKIKHLNMVIDVLQIIKSFLSHTAQSDQPVGLSPHKLAELFYQIYHITIQTPKTTKTMHWKTNFFRVKKDKKEKKLKKLIIEILYNSHYLNPMHISKENILTGLKAIAKLFIRSIKSNYLSISKFKLVVEWQLKTLYHLSQHPDIFSTFLNELSNPYVHLLLLVCPSYMHHTPSDMHIARLLNGLAVPFLLQHKSEHGKEINQILNSGSIQSLNISSLSEPQPDTFEEIESISVQIRTLFSKLNIFQNQSQKMDEAE